MLVAGVKYECSCCPGVMKSVLLFLPFNWGRVVGTPE